MQGVWVGDWEGAGVSRVGWEFKLGWEAARHLHRAADAVKRGVFQIQPDQSP
jgi:hypothetical protein